MLNADGKLYFGSFDDKVYQLDIATRTQQPAGSGLDLATEWSFDTGAWVWAMPLPRDGVLYVSTLAGQVYALNQESGTPVWDAPAQLEGEIVARPAVINSNRGPALAVPSSTGDVYVVVIENGQVTGQFGTGGNGVKSSPAAVGDDSLFVHTVNGQLRVYNATSLAQQTCIEPKGGGAQC
jgi:outer membrane protein assembly factor BamB